MERDQWLAWYVARGFATIPLRPREKRPLRSGWRDGGAEAWRGAPEDANLGVLCGAPSGGLVVLDFDTWDGPREASGMRPEELAVHTLVARTARGWHVYALDSTARTCSPWRGLDIRAEGSMVVAPPSTHQSGASYSFVNAEAPVTALSNLPFSFEPHAPQEAHGVEVDWDAIETLVSAQAPKLRAHWAVLKRPAGEFDRSRADFALARCLWEAGYEADRVAAVLLALPGSKARERGEGYAMRTAVRAANARRP